MLLLVGLGAFSLGAALPLLSRLINHIAGRIEYPYSVVSPNKAVRDLHGGLESSEHLRTLEQQ